MKNKKLLAMFSAAFALAMSADLAAADFTTTFSVDAGYRHGHAKRKIALSLDSAGSFPSDFAGNITHNTKYNIWDVQLWSRTVFDEQYVLKANVGLGRVYKASESMDCRDVKYGGGILAPAYSDMLGRKRTSNKKKHGNAYNALLGIGYLVPINESLALVPSVGFEHQQMSIRHYMNESSVTVKANAKQKERWSGFFVGLDAPINFDCGLKVVPNIQYTFAKYKTQTSSKPVGSDGRYYYHGSKMGHIIKVGLDAFMPINDQLTFDVGYSFQRKTAKPKLKTLWVGDSTLANGTLYGKDNKAKIKVNEHSVNLGLTYVF